MATIVGQGDYKYEIKENWAKLPDGWSFKEVAAVGVDRQDNVYCFTRGEHPVIVFDRDGNFLRSWGEGQYIRAHGVHMGPDDSIYLTDDGGHFVRKCSLDGKVLLELGVPGKPAPYLSGEPFNRCTHTALSPKGEIYVSDGYGNAKVHKYAPDGKLLLSWGEPGSDPGQFNSSTTSARMPMAGSMWPTVRTTGSRYSTAVASTRPNGTTSTGRAGFTWIIFAIQSAISANFRLIASTPISGRGSASSTIRANCCRGSATRLPDGR